MSQNHDVGLDVTPQHDREASAGNSEGIEVITEFSPPKRKLENETNGELEPDNKRRKGTAPIKEEYLLSPKPDNSVQLKPQLENIDDDAAEAFHHKDRQPASSNSKSHRKKNQGQNKARTFGSSKDEVGLCSTRTWNPEFSPRECPFGSKCRFEHDLRKYLREHKRGDLNTFGGLCPVWEARGKCSVGWKCRFVGSHSQEVEHQDGRKELVLVEDAEQMAKHDSNSSSDGNEVGVVNNVDTKDKMLLTKKKLPTPKSDKYLPWMEASQGKPEDQGKRRDFGKQNRRKDRNSSSPEPENDARNDNRASYVEAPLLPSEKRRLYFGPDTPVLAPLTTQGNLPFRQLCSSLGASFTYSEMAMSMPLLTGQKSEWALLKAHESEILPPSFVSNDQIQPLKQNRNIVYDYNQSSDLRFGAQIAANKPWLAIKTTEVLTALLPDKSLRVIDVNCGCPIDLVYREGAGSALMDSPNKLDKMLRGMNVVSGPTPITCKIRTGTRDKQPTAQKLVERLVLGAQRDSDHGHRETPCGVAAITLHGRSRQQRYTKLADWEYISSTAELINELNAKADRETDTIREADERDLANNPAGRKNKVYFLGNGDVYSHIDYYNHLEQTPVDAVMVARGALIKPWVFEEIATGQYLDKSSSERLGYIEQFVRSALMAWGSDEHGVGQTRRFLLEWLSFSCRYVPIGVLEYLPPKINDRPPAYRGRDELETLLASDNYKDWIKISEMFLGPAHKDFRFEPKHKSNSYESVEAEG